MKVCVIDVLKIKNFNTFSGSIYKKYLTFLIYYINNVFCLYSRQNTLITQ